jgi:Kef-type K+ transport system membrane component KefB
MNRNFVFYMLLFAIFGSLLWFVFSQGAKLEDVQSAQLGTSEAQQASNSQIPKIQTTTDESAGVLSIRNLSQNMAHPLSRLLLQIAVIVVAARVLAFLISKIGQPPVIGEIIAGIILGPSLLGLFWPGITNFLFQPESLPNLQFLSQLGLILFMFIVGLELDVDALKHQAHTAVLVSNTSIIFPFFCGVTLAYFLYESLAPARISFLAFGLFMGIAMSITAFPVLARIIHDRGLARSPVGALALTSAAAGDVTAWCILAAVIAIVQAGTAISALFTVLLAGIYVAAMLALVRPLLQQLEVRIAAAGNLSRAFTVIAFAVLFLSAFATEVIGIHALFGAFLAGVVMPAHVGFRRTLASKIEDVSLVILLPLFFAFTGLKTQVGLLNDAYSWLVCGLIIVVAVVGKVGGSLVAAKFTGQSWSDSVTIGALMNTRGLMELIVLDIGYELGVLSPTVFTMLVLMALVTTFMTSPALAWIERIRGKKEAMSVRPLPERL